MQGFFYVRKTRISNLGPRIWNLVPERLKDLNCTCSLKNEHKQRQPEVCPRRLCLRPIPCVGFL